LIALPFTPESDGANMKFFSIRQTIKLITLTLSFCFFTCAYSNTIAQADGDFQKENYQSAYNKYLKVALVGSPHAFYQLGTIHLKGLGFSKDPIKAIVWFSLAAEQGFLDSEKVFDELMSNFSKTDRTKIMEVVTAFQENYGIEKINNKLFPVINQENLEYKIQFGENGADIEFFPDDNLEDLDFGSDETLDFDGEDSDGDQLLIDNSTSTNLLNRPFSASVDYDIALDGSTRNMQPLQTMGHTAPALYELSTHKTPAPYFKDTNVHFFYRAHIGLASFSEGQMKDKYRKFNSLLKRKTKKLRKSTVLEDKFKLALALMAFEWLAEDETEINQLLLDLSMSGHPMAQYEYGAKLYREQNNITQAIHWIGEASKYGISKAEYLLGRILLNSPWVEHDEQKALFWLESAAKKAHQSAQLKTAELKLLANNSDLHNLEEAQKYLFEYPEKGHDQPEYQYLMAMVNNQVKPRRLSDAVQYLRTAIDLGEDLDWDVSAWQNQLTRWTTSGSVTIVE
jgi:TPR repeat protein